jgi:hypothetical protein
VAYANFNGLLDHLGASLLPQIVNCIAALPLPANASPETLAHHTKAKQMAVAYLKRFPASEKNSKKIRKNKSRRVGAGRKKTK